MSTRRGFLGGTVAVGSLVAAPAIPAWPTPVPHLDAQLLRLNAQLTVAWAQENHDWALAEGEFDDDGPLTIKANESDEATATIASQIENQPALTLDGLFVKLRAASWCRSGAAFTVSDLDHRSNPSLDIRILASIIIDLSAMGRA